MGAIRIKGVSYQATKTYFEESHRTTAPGKVLDLIRPWIQSAGITRLANISGLDRIGIPVALSIRPNSRTLVCSAGKGLTLEAALVSAAMEGIEIFRAEDVKPEVTRISYSEVSRYWHTIPAELLPLKRHAVFDPHWPHDWILGWDLIGQCETLVPLSLVGPLDPEVAYALPILQSSSNGLASGSHMLEAINGALLEVIERDAVACLRHQGALQERWSSLFDLGEFASERMNRLAERLMAVGVGALVLDCTCDTRVPVYQVFLYDRQIEDIGVYHGFGAHLDPEVAVLRALLEAVQSRAVYIAGSRDDYFDEDLLLLRRRTYKDLVERLHASVKQGYTIPTPILVTATLEGDLVVLLDLLRAVGIEQVIVVDLSPPASPIAIVKVIVPGMEGYVSDAYSPGKRALRKQGGGE